MQLQDQKETLSLHIEFDKDTGLPLFVEYKKILDLILTYLPLPYRIAEYGCGKKTSIILNKLIDLGIPAFSLKRGMIIEKDMSDDALNERDYTKRPHALVIHNPIYETDINDEVLQKMFMENGIKVNQEKQTITTGKFTLVHDKLLQFSKARSHVFPIITFWNKVLNRQEELALDPTIDPKGIFSIEELRDMLRGPQALIFKAPILGDFVLDTQYLTVEQNEELYRLLDGRSLYTLNKYEYNELIRNMNRASKGSIGDPARWSYANNIKVNDLQRYKKLKGDTGKGNKINGLFDQMMASKKHGTEEKTRNLYNELKRVSKELHLPEVIKEDAIWSEEMLKPLADVANTISYFHSYSTLVEWVQDQKSITDHVNDIDYLDKLHGMGVQLRDRIETLGKLSLNQDSEVDARALNYQFFTAAVETIQQMNKTGLSVFIDKVGNIHGLLIDDKTKKDILANASVLSSLTKNAICHCSHIDTVKDAGKYDGRLGVLSGIELAHFLNDLQKYHGINVKHPGVPNVMMVSAYIGEEMTFTGEGVSMPGSSAVTGTADIADIYNMKNREGETFKERLIEFLEYLKDEQDVEQLDIVNDFSYTFGEQLLNKCFAPEDFFTPYTYERHIEQGPKLDRHQIPLVLVDTIMGIFQEDFYFNGISAERAALEFNRRLRKLALKEAYKDIRITVGITEPIIKTLQLIEVDYGMRWHIQGEKNHAGATLTEDRKDPGVACSRLAEKFLEITSALEKEKGTSLESIAGEIVFMPGTNRNVIPSNASVSFGFKCKSLSDEEISHINKQLNDFVIHELSKPVAEGGEGVLASEYEEVTSVNVASSVRSSIDLRGTERDNILQFRAEIDEIIGDLDAKYGTEIDNQVEQELDPYPLSKSGQVLQIERSYGGSHNPNESELSKDLLRGTLIQLGVTWDFLQLSQLNTFNLYAFTNERLPESWKTTFDKFVSGALHDTCNIARKTLNMATEVVAKKA